MTGVIVGLLALFSSHVSQGGILTLRVVDRETGDSVSNAIVLAMTDVSPMQTALANDDGRASLVLPGASTVWLSIRSPDHSARCVTVTDLSSVMTVALDKTVTVHGRISDTAGRGVAGAMVKMSHETDPACRVQVIRQPAITDANGDYVVRAVDVSRPFTLRVVSERHQSASIDRSEVMASIDGDALRNQPGKRSKKVDLTLIGK